MTQEEVYEFITNKIVANGVADPELFSKELNGELSTHGWTIKTFKKVGNVGFGFDVIKTSDTGSSSLPTTSSGSVNGVTCKKCHTHNSYLDTPSEADGTHLCYSCRQNPW